MIYRKMGALELLAACLAGGTPTTSDT